MCVFVCWENQVVSADLTEMWRSHARIQLHTLHKPLDTIADAIPAKHTTHMYAFRWLEAKSRLNVLPKKTTSKAKWKTEHLWMRCCAEVDDEAKENIYVHTLRQNLEIRKWGGHFPLCCRLSGNSHRNDLLWREVRGTRNSPHVLPKVHGKEWCAMEHPDCYTQPVSSGQELENLSCLSSNSFAWCKSHLVCISSNHVSSNNRKKDTHFWCPAHHAEILYVLLFSSSKRRHALAFHSRWRKPRILLPWFSKRWCSLWV